MKQITLVTAKIVRENEKYAYKLKGKGEKYLVMHDLDDPAELKVLTELTPFAKTPIAIESIVLQKNSEVIFSSSPKEACQIFKVSAKITLLDEEHGKEIKQTLKFYVQANSIDNALLSVGNLNPDATITSISKTNIIDILL